MKSICSFAFLLVFCLLFAHRGDAAVSEDERLRQENLALDYQLRLTRTAAENVEERERLYLALVDECPDTEAAQEALWALANLYLDDFDEPQESRAEEVLEYFVKNYPASPWILQVENRLIWLYEDTGNPLRVPELYEDILKRDMPLSIRLNTAFRCAQAWEAAKQPEKAREWYTRIIKEGGSGNYPEVAAAKARLAVLKKS